MHRPHVRFVVGLAAGLTISLLAGCAGSAHGGGAATTSQSAESTAPAAGLETELLAALNSHRSSIGAGTLAYHTGVAALAREHNDAMTSGLVGFGHSGFQQRGLLISSLTGHRAFAENVSRKRVDAAKLAATIVEAWRNSPRHRANMENPRFTTTGLAVAQAGDGNWYATALFSGL